MLIFYKDDDIPPPPSSSTYGFSTAGASSTTPSWNLPTPAPTYVNANPTSSYLDSYQSQVNNLSFMYFILFLFSTTR